MVMTFRDREKPKMEKMFDLMFLLCCSFVQTIQIAKYEIL
jgi:hypothetical protein